jgi:hypothetical protein
VRATDILVEAPVNVPGVIRIVASDRVGVEDVEGIDPALVSIDEADAKTLFVDARQHASPFVVRVGETRYVFRAAERLEWWVETLRPLEVAPFEEISASGFDWSAAGDDEWLSRQIAADSSISESWRAAVTVGMFARLYEPPSGERPRAIVQAILRGELEESIARPRRWVRSLTASQLETLQDLALAEADLVLRTIESLDATYEPTEPDWQRQLLEICRRREDVEGVSLLLHEAGADRRLTSGLGLLDDIGRAFMFDVPIRIAPFDERLRRVASFDPEAWWAEPARWERPE